tara:strand:+ start:617 stop:922 length:306 start_codon:yes stop_codon:yes gene_type:complete
MCRPAGVKKREDLISCCTNALNFYGGVPKAIVSDNRKSAVTRASKYEADINRSFKDFERHYNCVINPRRGYSPPGQGGGGERRAPCLISKENEQDIFFFSS